jgi:hypothetical protein
MIIVLKGLTTTPCLAGSSDTDGTKYCSILHEIRIYVEIH